MTVIKLETVSERVKSDRPYSLDEALNVVGIGWYNLRCSLALAFCLIASIMDVVGASYVLPAAKCDLNMTDAQRGLIASLPYAAIILTSFFWGYLVDTRGRRTVLIWGCTLCGVCGMVAGLMPDLISFVVFKFIASLCLACPSNVPYPFIGEIMPPKHRDVALSLTNALQIFGAGFVPVFAWLILPADFRLDFQIYEYRPWRLLTMVYSSILLLCALFMYWSVESPKHLIAQGKHDEALAVLKKMYAGNKRKSAEDFPIKLLEMPVANNCKQSFLSSLKVQTMPLLRAPYSKWMALNGLLLFGVFSSLNGLFVWVPDILNRVFSGTAHEGQIACTIIRQGLEEKLHGGSPVCVDSIEPTTYIINTVANFSCAVITVVASATVRLIGKKPLLIIVFALIGTMCFLNNVVTSHIALAVTLSSVQLLSIGIGPTNAYAVDIFPTHLRGMAVSLTMMIGRVGSMVGTNGAGLLINTHCETTFYVFGGFLYFCAVASLLLPKSAND